jgi:hypothetical protein
MKYLLSWAILLVACHSPAQWPYSFRRGADPNGIDKYYLGRQIAHIMGHQGIDWLERPERELEEQTTLLLKNLGVKSGETVADIGAGSG